MTTCTAEQWETAFDEYVEALRIWEIRYPYRFKRGLRRDYQKSAARLVAAKEALRNLDSEFCNRNGI